MGALRLAVFTATLTGGCDLARELADERRFRHALTLQKANAPESALRVYRAMQPVERRHPGALNNMGVIEVSRGRLQRAERYFAKAAELDPDSVTAWTNLGVVRFHLGRRSRARAALRRARAARRRALHRALPSGRVNWRYDAVQRATAPADAIAARYLARL